MEKTLAEARQELQEALPTGAICPCCDQFAKVYSRPITSSMAYGLILLSQATDEWIHIENYLKTLNIPSSIRGDLAKLKHWGLIEGAYGLRDDKSPRNGYYRVTERGRRFVNKEIRIHSHVDLFNGELYDTGEEYGYVSIEDALGTKFHYDNLMRNTL